MFKYICIFVATLSLVGSSFAADSLAQRRLDSIVKGLDNSYQIRNLRVLPGGTVTLPAGAIGAAALPTAVQERTPIVNVTAIGATNIPLQIAIQIEDSTGTAIAAQREITIWQSATAYGAPAAGLATNSEASVGTILVEDTADALWRGVTSADGLFTLDLVFSDVTTNYINVSVGGSSDSAVIRFLD